MHDTRGPPPAATGIDCGDDTNHVQSIEIKAQVGTMPRRIRTSRSDLAKVLIKTRVLPASGQGVVVGLGRARLKVEFMSEGARCLRANGVRQCKHHKRKQAQVRENYLSV